MASWKENIFSFLTEWVRASVIEIWHILVTVTLEWWQRSTQNFWVFSFTGRKKNRQCSVCRSRFDDAGHYHAVQSGLPKLSQFESGKIERSMYISCIFFGEINAMLSVSSFFNEAISKCRIFLRLFNRSVPVLKEIISKSSPTSASGCLLPNLCCSWNCSDAWFLCPYFNPVYTGKQK